jgi:hypothetical protein
LTSKKQSFAKQLLMEQKKLEVVEKLKQDQNGASPRLGKGFDSGGNHMIYFTSVEASLFIYGQ